MKSSGPKRWIVICLLYICFCLVIDFYPRFAPPDFRYTGSDSSAEVLNLGWPMALTIYDPRSGWHAGPLALLVVGHQLFMLFAAVSVVVFNKMRGL